MIEHPEAVKIAGQIDRTLSGKRIAEAVRGNAPHRLELSPSVLTLGTKGGSTAALTHKGLKRVIKFTNYGEEPARLTGATVDNPAIKLNVA